MKRSILALLLALTFTFGLSACEEAGDEMEEAGDEMEDATD